MSGNEIARFADVAMYDAEDMPFDVNREGPQVHLLSMNADPLGDVAAMSMMYEGRVARSLADVTDSDRKHYFDQIKRTHLKAPFESVKFHFMIEGVTRSFTHQMVRQRTAVYAQESLRFAVKDTIDEEVALPPSLRGLKDDDPRVLLWRKAINRVDDTYHALVDGGIPAEDARGLLPHNITTRLHYVTDLRALQDHAGMRLCTQAQFEWRQVFVRIVEAIRNYDPFAATLRRNEAMVYDGAGMPVASTPDRWQFEEVANLFRPVCYLTGKCEFNASFDRHCSIRSRVNENAGIGRDSSEWGEDWHGTDPRSPSGAEGFIGKIDPREWLMDPTSARTQERTAP